MISATCIQQIYVVCLALDLMQSWGPRKKRQSLHPQGDPSLWKTHEKTGQWDMNDMLEETL